MDNPLETVKKQLRKDLKDYRKYLHVLNRMNFDALPLHFNASYAGISLNEISLPTVHGDPEGIFDAWLWPVLEGRTDTQLDELAEVTNKDFALFVSQDPDIGVCTVLLMCALTRIPGTTMTCDKDSVLMHYKDRVFGIERGLVRSRFCTGLPISVDHMGMLAYPRKCRTGDSHFIALYREAYRLNNGSLEALLTIKSRYPKYLFKNLSPRDNLPLQMTPKRMDRLIAEIMSMDVFDPLLSAYTHLVPRYMTAAQFERHVSQLSGRRTNLDERWRQVQVNKIIQFFDKKKKEQE